MDFEDEDIFLDIDPKLLSLQDGIHNDGEFIEHSIEKKTGFECHHKHISKDLQTGANSFVGFINNVLNFTRTIPLDEHSEYTVLYDYVFEKSTALAQDTHGLFNLTFTNTYKLESLLNSVAKASDFKKVTGDVLTFFQYVLHYEDTYLMYHNNTQENILNIWNNFRQLKLSMKPLHSIGSAMINNQALCHQQFHFCLNIHLYYLISFHKLLSIKNDKENATQFTQYRCEVNTETSEFNVDTLRTDILIVMVQLTELILKSFNKMSHSEDVFHMSPFKCDCIAEFWFILKLLCKKIEGPNSNGLFWKHLETVFELMENSIDEEDKYVDGYSEVPTYLPCNKPYLYSVWFLKHLLSLNIHSNRITDDNMETFNDGNDCTEKIVKKLTTIDCTSENEMRIIVTLLDHIISLKEPCKPDIIVALWEYFHKRLNSNFVLKSMPFAYTLSCLNSNRSVLEVLNHVEQLMSSARKQKNEENSYTLFLRILGLYLMKYNHDQRVWNQIKGRMYSKFSKLNTLTEQGIQHVSNLFILLFFIKGMQELGKIQTFLTNILSIKEKDTASSTREIVLRTNLTFALINIINKVSVEPPMLSPISSLVNQNCEHPKNPNYEKLMNVYLQTVKDIFKASEDLTLGQHLLLGPWAGKILTNSNTSSNVLNVFYTLLSQMLRMLIPYQPIDRESQTGMYFAFILEHVLPHLRTDLNFNPDTKESMTEFLSELTLFTLSGGVNYKSEASSILNKLIVNSNVNFELKMNYVKCLLSSEDMHRFSLSTFIPDIENIITQCYVLSLILSEHSNNDGMGRYVEAHCLHRFKQNYASHCSQTVSVQTINSCNEETLRQFLQELNFINAYITDLNSKTQFHKEVNALFSIEDTLRHVVTSNDKNNTSTGKTIITSVFTSVGIILDHIGGILYKKSKPNTQLQCFVDTLLLQFQVRSADFKLSENTTHALRVAFHIYINALMKLDPSTDMYIARVIKEMIQIYLPRLMNKTPYETRFSLVKCFNQSQAQDMYLLDMMPSLFLRRKCKISDKNGHECLVFVLDLLNEYTSVEFTSRVIKTSLDLLLNNLISLNEVDVCRNKIKTILTKCFANPEVEVTPIVKNHVMIVLTKLSNENLAFSFSQYFQVLNFLLQSCCPRIVAEFRRNILIQKIKTVEMKRGVGEDKVLRNLLEQLDRNIKKVLLVKSS